jgi:L-serine dehydratase
MGPRRAGEEFLRRYPQAKAYRVTLFGSLASTGKGHLTDRALLEVFGRHPIEITWRPEELLPVHPNGMRFEALDDHDRPFAQWEAYSIGGGDVLDPATQGHPVRSTFPHDRLSSIIEVCDLKGLSFWEYVEAHEGNEIWVFLAKVWEVMEAAIQRGLSASGTLPGDLGLFRKAKNLRRKAEMASKQLRQDGLVASYAYAVAEENAAGHEVVTAPTCGASGVLPAVLFHLKNTFGFVTTEILQALATAGLFGNLIKHNASISGAQVGCQGEIGTACAMAAAAATQLYGGTIRQIECASEMGLEHHLGLTCDPVGGLVQIPCIERNAHAAARAFCCSHFALLSDGTHKISFDDVVEVMKDTGCAIPSLYKETSEGGLAKIYKI